MSDIRATNLDELDPKFVIEMALVVLSVGAREHDGLRNVTAKFNSLSKAFLFAAVCRGVGYHVGDVCGGGVNTYLLNAMRDHD